MKISNHCWYAMYLDYFNNFLTIDCWAEYYEMTRNEALRVLTIGRMINNTFPRRRVR